MGGWAVTEELRGGTTEAVRMVVTIYALARILGGALGISTVTKRHASASILRRLGGALDGRGGGTVPRITIPAITARWKFYVLILTAQARIMRRAVRRCQDTLAHIPFLAPEAADLSVAVQSPLAVSATA